MHFAPVRPTGSRELAGLRRPCIISLDDDDEPCERGSAGYGASEASNSLFRLAGERLHEDDFRIALSPAETIIREEHGEGEEALLVQRLREDGDTTHGRRLRPPVSWSIAALFLAGAGLAVILLRRGGQDPAARSAFYGERTNVMDKVLMSGASPQSCHPIAGNSDISASGFELLPPFMRMIDIQPTFELHVDTISYYCEKASTIKSSAAVYGRQGLLGGSGPAEVRSCQAGEWTDVPISPPITLAAGETYYIAHLHALGIWSTARGTCNQFCKHRGNHFSARWDHTNVPEQEPAMEVLGDGVGQSLPLVVKSCKGSQTVEDFEEMEVVKQTKQQLEVKDGQVHELADQLSQCQDAKENVQKLMALLRVQVAQDREDRRKQFQLQTEQGQQDTSLLHDRTEALTNARDGILELKEEFVKANETHKQELAAQEEKMKQDRNIIATMTKQLEKLESKNKALLAEKEKIETKLSTLNMSEQKAINKTVQLEHRVSDENTTIGQWTKAMQRSKLKTLELERALRDLNKTNQIFAKDSLKLYKQVLSDKQIMRKQTNTISEAESNISRLSGIVGTLFGKLQSEQQTVHQQEKMLKELNRKGIGSDLGGDAAGEAGSGDGGKTEAEQRLRARLQQAHNETSALKENNVNLTKLVAELNQQILFARLKMQDGKQDVERLEGALADAEGFPSEEDADTAKTDFAFVMMSYTPEGQTDQKIWGVLALAMAIRRLSEYPLVLLTNTTHLPDGSDLKASLKKLSVNVLPVHEVKVPPNLQPGFTKDRWAFWKLQVWSLTQYKKLIWLDWDTMLYRSIDWLFGRPGMWAQRDDRQCTSESESMCSGIMMLEPNQDDFEGLQQYAASLESLPEGDQQLIAMYFSRVVRRPVNLLSEAEASFGQCVGRAESFYRDVDGGPVAGLWDLPAVIHKSGGYGSKSGSDDYGNSCFTPNMTLQLYQVGETIINICQFNPFGAYWRSMFCKAAQQVLDIQVREVTAFCDDACWYKGKGDRYFDKAEGVWCSQNATITEQDYENKALGHPIRRKADVDRALLVSNEALDLAPPKRLLDLAPPKATSGFQRTGFGEEMLDLAKAQ